MPTAKHYNQIPTCQAEPLRLAARDARNAGRARKVLRAYLQTTGDPHADLQQALVDLLADCMHLERQAADRLRSPVKERIAVERALTSAWNHFEAEIGGEM
jgi:hypothetical protein